MDRIETRLLRYFGTLAEKPHFRRAANAAGIGPPALTNQIQLTSPIQKWEQRLNGASVKDFSRGRAEAWGK